MDAETPAADPIVDRLANELIKAFDTATDSPHVGEWTATLEELPPYPQERWRAVARKALGIFGGEAALGVYLESVGE